MAYRGYDPDKHVPDLAGRVILVTGGTSHAPATSHAAGAI